MTIRAIPGLLCAVCVLLFCNRLSAQQAAAGKSLLWRISGKGLDKPSYLFAMLDFICSEDYLWTKSMEDCLAGSDKVCFGVDRSNADAKEQLHAVMNKGDKKLADYFSPLNYPVVTQYARNELSVDLSKLQAYQPVAIQPAIIKKLLACSAPVTYESRLMEKAKKDQKTITGLGTVDEVMDEIERTHFNDMVATVLTEMANGSTYYHDFRVRLTAAYKQQNLQLVDEVFRGNKALSKEQLNILLNEQSKTWVSRMPAFMQHSSVFFSLNAANCGGKEGIIILLRKAGYTLEPVL
jgi:uncharacterized protein